MEATRTAQPLAPNYSAAKAQAVEITLAELIAKLEADNNPSVYQYGKARRIAMNLHTHTAITYPFVGFEYCNRNGYTDDGIADFSRFTKRRGNRHHEYIPTVFQFDSRSNDRPGGYFFTTQRKIEEAA